MDSNRSPKATAFKAFESQSEFSAQLDAQAQQSPMSATIDKLMAKQ